MKNIFTLFFVFIIFDNYLYSDKIYNEELSYFQYERTIDGDTFVISIKNIHTFSCSACRRQQSGFVW